MKKFQRIGAVAVIVILLSLYVVCFISALSGGEKAQVIFKATLGMTIALPILLYIFILFLKAAKKQGRTARSLPAAPADMDLFPWIRELQYGIVRQFPLPESTGTSLREPSWFEGFLWYLGMILFDVGKIPK